MGWMRDLLLGYTHGSSVARDKRIEGKIDGLSKKIDSVNAPKADHPRSVQEEYVNKGKNPYERLIRSSLFDD